MRPHSIEWPTLAVAGAIASGFVAVLTFHERLPLLAVIAALALLGAWYNSLQHEIVHGHPTPWSIVNTALAIAPIGLVDSFHSYRAMHLRHHDNPDLTDPTSDPESFYVTAAQWARYGRTRRTLLHALRTLSGRLVLGPPLRAAHAIGRGAVAARRPATAWRVAAHLAAAGAVLVVVALSGLPIWVHLVGVVWGGGALTLLRSFAEHRYESSGRTRSAVVRSNWFFSLLFLNNNLHHTHHTRPGVAWYALPRAHDRLGSDAVADAGAGFYRGYGQIAVRFAVRPFDQPVFGTARSTITTVSSAPACGEPAIVSPHS